MAEWVLYRAITLDGYANSISGGNHHHGRSIPSSGHRFCLDSISAGGDYATNQEGNTKSKYAALVIYNRTSATDQTAGITYYGLNSGGNLAPMYRSGKNGSVKEIVEKWRD